MLFSQRSFFIIFLKIFELEQINDKDGIGPVLLLKFFLMTRSQIGHHYRAYFFLTKWCNMLADSITKKFHFKPLLKQKFWF
jgi:hypothetical protein